MAKSKYVFRNPEPPKSLEREVIARSFVRGLEKIAKFQVEQLSGDSWTHLKIHAPDGLVSIFKAVKDKRLKPIIKGTCVYVYIDSKVTPMDVRMLIGELLYNYKALKEPKTQRIRKWLGLTLLTLARKIYPIKRDKNG